MQLYLRATRFVLLFLVALGIPAFVLAGPILRFWIGPAFADRSSEVFRLLIVTYVLLGLTVVSYNIILAVGRPRVLGLFNVATFGLKLILILILIPKYGLLGAAWAYLLSVLPLVLLLLYAERRVLRVSQSHWVSLLGRLAIPAAAGTAASVAMLHIARNLAAVLLGAGLATALLVVSYLVVFAHSEDRDLVLRLLRPRRGRA